MKVVFDNLANFLSISPNQTPVCAVCLPGPSWTFLPFLFLLILYSLLYMYTLYNVHVLTPTWTVQYVISCAVNIRLQLYPCFLTMRSKHTSSKILNDIIGRNCLLGNRKTIAKFLMRTFTCRSTFLYVRYTLGFYRCGSANRTILVRSKLRGGSFSHTIESANPSQQS